jgi:hypothetical protein
MYRVPGAYSRKTTTSAPAVPPVRPTRDPPPGTVNDVVVRRLLIAGQDLQAALGLTANHPANGKIRHAADELDQAIRDIRGSIVDPPAVEPPPPGTSTGTT